MEYRRFRDTIIMRVDPEEEICTQMIAVADKENLMLAEINGLGAVKEFTTGVFDTRTKEYHANSFQGTFEIVSDRYSDQKGWRGLPSRTFQRGG